MKFFLFCAASIIILISCNKNEINLGITPDLSYTRIIQIDTINCQLSTVVLDSFITNSANSYPVGNFADPDLGVAQSSPYFQMSIPSNIPTIPANAVYDSCRLVINPTNNYYGDTTKTYNLNVYRLNQTINYTANSEIYNNNSFTYNSTPLGSFSGAIRPSLSNPILIKIDDNLGLDLYTKLKAKNQIVTDQSEFLKYFHGLKLSCPANQNLVYKFKGSSGDVALRIYYHNTTPYLDNKYVDFTSQANSFSFVSKTTDRTGTLLGSYLASHDTYSIYTEVPSSYTNNKAYTQFGMGMMAKVTFPTLQNVSLASDNIIKLQKAVLYVRPVAGTYNNGNLLPSRLYLALTNETNILGGQVRDSTGQSVQYAYPNIDYLLGANTFYRFNVTNYIGSFMSASESEKNGFYILQDLNTGSSLDRMVIANRYTPNVTYYTQLVLTVFYIKKI